MQERPFLGNATRSRAAVVADVRRADSAPLGASRRAAWATAVALLVAALGAAILWGANPTSRAAARDDGALRLHLPFALTGPRDIRGNERTTRSYRAVSPHAPQPISDVMARIIVSAATSLDGMEAVIVRQPSAHNQLDVGVFDAAPAAHRSLLLISHEAIAPILPGAAIGPFAAGMDLRWDAQAMAPIAIMPLVLLAQARPPVTRIPVSDLMQPRTRAEHGLQTVRIGSAGGRSASRMAAMLLAHASSLQQLHLDYNGGQSALNALVASEIDFLFAALPLVLPYVDAGRLRALGLASTERFPLLPQLPTLAEQGAPELVWEGWFGLYASRAISPRVREPLLGRVAESLASGPIRSVLLQQGLQPADPDAARFAARIAADRDRVARLLSGVD